MMWLLPVVSSVLLGLAALALIAWGWFLWLPLVGRIREDYGAGWAYAAFGGLTVLCVGVAWGLFQLQTRITAAADPRGRARPDVLFCQRCGRPAASGEYACQACGGTRFGMDRPHTAAPPDRTD